MGVQLKEFLAEYGFVNFQGTKSKTGKKTDQAGEKENDEDDANDEEEGKTQKISSITTLHRHTLR